jgi:hypothetical protein
MKNKPDNPPRPGKRNRGTSSCPPCRTASATGAEQVDPSEAAALLGLSEAALFALWRKKLGPSYTYLGTEVRFPRAGLAKFSEEPRSQALLQRFRSITAANLDRPLWHRISEKLDTLQAASPKTAGNRDVSYSYLGALYSAVREVNEMENRIRTFEELRSLLSDLIRLTSRLSKPSRSRNARALAFCYLDNVRAEDLRTHIGTIKSFVARKESPASDAAPATSSGRKVKAGKGADAKHPPARGRGDPLELFRLDPGEDF